MRPTDAEDVLQEVFRTVAGNVAVFRRTSGSGSFVAWLYSITHSRIVDLQRRQLDEPAGVGGSDFQQRLQEVPQAESDEDEAVFEQMALRQALDLVEKEVEAHTWQAFWRVVINGQDTARVAAELKMTPGAVRVAKSRVLRRLRDLLQ